MKTLSCVGEEDRRYGNLLFEICDQLLRSGKGGRLQKTLRKGAKVQGRSLKERLSISEVKPPNSLNIRHLTRTFRRMKNLKNQQIQANRRAGLSVRQIE